MESLRKIFSLLALLGFASVMAQTEESTTDESASAPEVHFSVIPAPSSNGLSDQASAALVSRIQQVVNRNSAGASAEWDPFAIQPTITVTDFKASQGLVQNVSLITGELALTALNDDTGEQYYGKTISLQAEASTDNEEQALLQLIKSIKVTDPAYTRFIRTARSKTNEYYASRGLPIPRRRPIQCDEKPEMEPVIDEYVPEPVVEESPVEPQPQPVTEPVVEKPVENDYTLTNSSKDYEIKVVSCIGDASRRIITITLSVENLTNDNINRAYINFLKAYNPDGDELNNRSAEQGILQDFPAKIKVKRTFVVQKVYDKFDYFSFLQLSIGNANVEIRNLKINWQ